MSGKASRRRVHANGEGDFHVEPIRDPKTGIPIIGAKDDRPIEIGVVATGHGVQVTDRLTGRPIHGIASIAWVANQQGTQMQIAFAAYKLELEQGAPDQRPVVLRDHKGEPVACPPVGAKLLVMGADGKVAGVLVSTKMPEPETKESEE